MTNHMITRFGILCLNRALLALLWIGLLTSHATSQTPTSTTVRINVVDVGGRAVPGATVVLKWKRPDEEITKVTTSKGAATFENSRTGTPDVTVSADGFATLNQSVTVHENQSNDFTLSIGLPIRAKLDSLKPGWGWRFARAFQYQYELSEQPGTVLVDFRRQSEEGVETETLPRPNPLDYLQKHSLTLKLSELIPDRLSLFKRGSDYLKKHPEAADGDRELAKILCDKKPLITCLTRGGTWWQRAAMGTSITAAVGQRPEVIDNILITSAPFDKKYQFTVGFAFDPAKLFPSASNWKSTLDDVQKIDSSLALIEVFEEKKQPWKQPWVLAAIIPKVEFKMIAQFDFLKFNEALRTAPFPEHALNTWTFTWDLTRAIPDTKNRIDADAIEEALYDLKSTLGREKQPAWEKQCRLYLRQEVREIEGMHPTFRAQSCKRLAEIMEVGYQLSCVLKDGKGDEKDRKDGTQRLFSDDPVLPDPNPCKWQ